MNDTHPSAPPPPSTNGSETPVWSPGFSRPGLPPRVWSPGFSRFGLPSRFVVPIHDFSIETAPVPWRFSNRFSAPGWRSPKLGATRWLQFRFSSQIHEQKLNGDFPWNPIFSLCAQSATLTPAPNRGYPRLNAPNKHFFLTTWTTDYQLLMTTS